MKTVILHRGSSLADGIFGPEEDRRAKQRAASLAYLHHAQVTEEGDTLHVWAEHYYKPCGLRALLVLS